MFEFVGQVLGVLIGLWLYDAVFRNRERGRGGAVVSETPDEDPRSSDGDDEDEGYERQRGWVV